MSRTFPLSLQNTKNSPLILPQCHTHRLMRLYSKQNISRLDSRFVGGIQCVKLHNRKKYSSALQETFVCITKPPTSLDNLSYHLPHVHKIYTASHPLSTIWAQFAFCQPQLGNETSYYLTPPLASSESSLQISFLCGTTPVTIICIQPLLDLLHIILLICSQKLLSIPSQNSTHVKKSYKMNRAIRHHVILKQPQKCKLAF